MKLILLAAGKSSRIYNKIKMNKCLIKLNKKTLIRHIIDNAYSESIKNIDIITGYKEYKIKNHYFPSKQNYVTRKMTYKNFITILRQICKYHHIPFTSTIKYDKSTYDISYSIFFDSEQ